MFEKEHLWLADSALAWKSCSMPPGEPKVCNASDQIVYTSLEG